MTLVVVLPLLPDHVDGEENEAADDLERDGDGEESDEEVVVGRVQGDGVAELVGVGSQEGDVHQTLRLKRFKLILPPFFATPSRLQVTLNCC